MGERQWLEEGPRESDCEAELARVREELEQADRLLEVERAAVVDADREVTRLSGECAAREKAEAERDTALQIGRGAQARIEEMRHQLEQAEAERDSLRFARDAAEGTRIRDNEFLLSRVKEAESRAEQAESRLAELREMVAAELDEYETDDDHAVRMNDMAALLDRGGE